MRASVPESPGEPRGSFAAPKRHGALENEAAAAHPTLKLRGFAPCDQNFDPSERLLSNEAQFFHLIVRGRIVVDQKLEVRVMPPPARGGRGERVVGGFDVAVCERVSRLESQPYLHLFDNIQACGHTQAGGACKRTCQAPAGASGKSPNNVNEIDGACDAAACTRLSYRCMRHFWLTSSSSLPPSSWCRDTPAVRALESS